MSFLWQLKEEGIFSICYHYTKFGIMTFVRAHYQRQTNENSSFTQSEDAEDCISVRSDIQLREEVQFLDPSNGNCFKKSWRKISVVALGVGVIILAIVFLSRESFQNKICLTPECIKIAANVLSSMDSSADPCDDFYKFACGGWEKANPIPDGKSSWSPFEKLNEANQLILRTILFANISETSSTAEEKTRRYFYSCMDDIGKIEEIQGAPLRKVINDDLKGWNLGNFSYNINEFNFQEKINLLQNKYHFGGFFTWSIGEDEKNSSRHVIQIDQGGLSLSSKDFYTNNIDNNKRVMRALEIMMIRIFRLLIQEEHPEEVITREKEKVIKKSVSDIISFEKDIANITTSSSERKQEGNLYNKLSLAKMDKNYSFMNWTEYFIEAFKQINRTITQNDVVIVYAPKFLSSMTQLINDRLQSDEGKNVLNNYIIWQAIRGMKSSLSKAYRDTDLILQKAMLGKEEHEERWRFCIADTDNVLGYALGAMFVRNAFQGKSKIVAESMIAHIKSAFIENLKQAIWMDENTKKKAIEKADAITDMIGYPDYILDVNELDKKYEDLMVTEWNYFGNNLAHAEFAFADSLKKLDQAVNSSQWSMTPPTVNAYYTPTKNQIVFPSGLLQTPFFSLNYPDSLNFGAMGVVMGHELSHAFDDEGRKYDKEGNMVDWWENTTAQNFKDKLGCMKQQYSHYSLHNESVNGNITVGENIADNGGLKASYRAFVEWMQSGETDDIVLPGVNLTHQQLFFVAFSQVWCSSTTKETDHLQLMEDHHSPGKFRVLGPLSNFEEFSRAFQCSSTAKMNPTKRCEIW